MCYTLPPPPQMHTHPLCVGQNHVWSLGEQSGAEMSRKQNSFSPFDMGWTTVTLTGGIQFRFLLRIWKQFPSFIIAISWRIKSRSLSSELGFILGEKLSLLLELVPFHSGTTSLGFLPSSDCLPNCLPRSMYWEQGLLIFQTDPSPSPSCLFAPV